MVVRSPLLESVIKAPGLSPGTYDAHDRGGTIRLYQDKPLPQWPYHFLSTRLFLCILPYQSGHLICPFTRLVAAEVEAGSTKVGLSVTWKVLTVPREARGSP